MSQEPSPQFFPSYNSQQWNTQIPWQQNHPWKPTWPQQYNQNHPWKQGWRGNTYGNIPLFPVPYQVYPQYPQYPSPIPQSYPPMQTQVSLSQPTIPPLPQLTANPNPPRPMQLPAQPIPNPNNLSNSPAFNVELPTFPTYLVTPVPLQDIHLRSGKVLKPKYSTVVIEEEMEEEETPDQTNNDDQPEEVIIPTTQTPSTSYLQQPQATKPQSSTLHTQQSQVPKIPPYPERLAIEKLVAQPEFDLEVELKNVCVKIPMLQA
jgi:hypothetical protein